MGLFDSIAGAVQSQVGNLAAQGNIGESLLGLINDPATGGLSGLIQKMSQGGLGEQVASWVGNGANLPVSAAQIQAMLASSGLKDIAAKFGLGSAESAGGLAAMLPQLIDKLTPNGEIPQGKLDATQALSALGGLFGK